jgi:hypothetical protein
MRGNLSQVSLAGQANDTDQVLPGLMDDKLDISRVPIPSVPNPRLEY